MKALTRMFDGNGLSLGRWSGIPVSLDWSWLLLFGIFLVLDLRLGALWGCLFVIVLLHEFGHCFAGRHLGCRVESIRLYAFGGAARMQIPEKPKEEVIVALAGPAVNVALIPIFSALGLWFDFMSKLAMINLLILGFNLIPAFPMDGGRVLRGTLSHYWQDPVRATKVAMRVTLVCCGLFVAYGLYSLNPMLLVVAAFIFIAGRNEQQQVEAMSLVDRTRFTTYDQARSEAERIILDAQRNLERLNRSRL